MSDELDFIAELMLSEPTVAKLNAPAVAAALVGFELEPRRDMSWIARAIQGALYASMTSADERADRRSNAEIRDELHKLAGDCSKLWLRLSQRSGEADQVVWDTRLEFIELIVTGTDYALRRDKDEIAPVDTR